MRKIIVALLFCGAALPAYAQDLGGAKEASQRFASAMSGGDATTAAALFSDDAYVLPPGRGELKGKSEIQGFLNRMAHGVQGLQYTSEDIQPIGEGAAREMGTFTFKMRAKQGSSGSPQEVTGKYLLIWQKSGSDWRIVADMWNRNGNGNGGAQGGAGHRGGQGGGAMAPQNDAQ